MTPEGKVVVALKKAVKELGGETRKMTWVGHAGAPDLCILFPDQHLHILVEVKAPGKKPEPHQLREHDRLRKAGFEVWVMDSASGFLWGLLARVKDKGFFDRVVDAYHAWKIKEEKTCEKA